MRLIANKQLKGAYGLVSAGDSFECETHIGQQLIKKGLARPAQTYETKEIVPEPIVSGDPFRLVYHPEHSEPPSVLGALDQAISETDVAEAGTPDPPRRKRGRPRKNPAA